MSLFDKLLVAHLVGDWLLQTEWQALNKDRSWRAMLVHVVLYHAVVLLALWSEFGLRNAAVYVAVAGLAVSHAWLDRRWPVVSLMRSLRLIRERSAERWLVIAVDQCLHIVLLGLAALYLTGRSGL